MGSGRRVRFVLLALFVMQTTAEKCKPSTCFSKLQAPLFDGKTGQQFTYEFESTATAQLVNKETAETSVALKGTAVVTVENNCGYSLQLKNVFAFGSDQNKLNVQKDFELPVQFTLSGDELSPELCAEANDGTFSLNVKRGVISALQNAAGRGTELDIFGKCPVSASSSTSGGVTTVTSTRDLDQCAYREKLSNGLIQGVVTENSEIKSSPILSGRVESDAKYKDGALQSIELRENYNFLPFSTQAHGAKAKVNTKLTLKKSATGQPAAMKSPVLRTLLFENSNTNMVNQKVKVKDSIKAAFGKTLQEFTGQEGVISSKSAATFAEIIRLMRLAKKADLLTSYQDMKKGTLSDLQKSASMKTVSRNIFLDALFRTGTGDSVAALADLAKKELSEKEQQLMYLSFNLVQSVNKDAITSLARLFTENLPKEAYLSIGSIVNKFCRDRGCEAGDVKVIADKFISKIPKDCKTSNKQEEETLVAVLKGIRNSQTILNSALDRIIQCASNKNPNRIRVVAFQAFTANPCNKKLQQAAVATLKNRDEDSEVRIEAYLAAIECPSGALANDVQALLNTEQINQVGSFINSHLDSIKASTDPKREATRAHFRNIRTSKKYPFDPRRYSFNREVSYAIDALGLGSAVDSSVIYSQQSFLPRSLRLNVTGNLFGSAFNMLEVSARQENLESLIEHYFGPRGVFSRMSKQEIFDAIRNEISAATRHKRALPGDLAAFDKQVKMSSEYNREPDLDLSLKVFGSELYFLSMSQNFPATPADLLKLFATELSKGIDGLKNFNYNFENHALWMDGEIVYPTALGLPFRLSSVGSSALKLDLSGSIDVKAIVENPFDSKAHLTFSPAANIYIAGQMGFSAYAFESALEVAGTFYTNGGAKTTVEVQNGRTFVVNTVPTVKEQYIVDLTHEVSTVSQESGREAVKVPVKFKRNDRDAQLCFDQVEFLTGFTFCTHVDLMPMNISEHAHWPLYGQNHLNVKLEMVDAITFKAELDDKEPGKPAINFYYDTPHNGKTRQTSLKLLSSFNPDHFMGGFDVSVPIQADSPFKISASAGFVNQDNEKRLYLDGHYLGGEYKYELGFRRKGNQIEPILKLNTDLAYIGGKIIETKTPNGVKYDLRQVKFGSGSSETIVDGSIEVNGPKLVSNLRFVQGGNSVAVAGSLGFENGQLDSDLQVSSGQVAAANGKVNYSAKMSDSTLKNDLKVVWDKDPNSKVNKFVWSQFADWSDKDLFKMQNALEVGKFNAAGRLNGEFGKKLINIDSGLEYNNQKAEFKLDNKYSQRQPHDYDTSIYAAANQKSIKVEMKRDIEGDSSKITNKLELSTGLRLEINGKVGHEFDCKKADVSLQGVFVPGPKKDQTKVTIFLKNTERDHSANSKITVGRTEFANFESKLTYGSNMVGSLKASAANAISADGNFQSNNGRGNAVINAAIKDRKLKAESQFNIQKPTFDFSTDVYYDYEKDNSKKVHFATKNQVQDKSLVSKNEVEVFGEHYAFNVDASNDGTFSNGKQKGSAEVVLPTGRKFALSADREARLEDDSKGSGSLHLTATDELPNKQQRQAILDLKVTDLNRKDGFFDMSESLKYHGFDNKDLTVKFAAKNLKKGHYSTASAALDVAGALSPDAINVKINLDEYCDNHAIYSGSGNYGRVGDISVNGKFYVGNKDRPHSHDFNGVLNLPNTNIRRLVVTSNGQFTEPADPEGTYIVKYSGDVELAGKKAHVETDVKASTTKGSGSAKLQLPDIKPISGEVSFNCNHKDKADGSISVNYGDNKNFKSAVNVQVEGDKNLNADLSLSGDAVRNLKLRVNAKQPNENEIVAKVNLDADNEKYSLDYDHRLTPNDPRFSVVIVRPQGTSKILAEANLESQFKGRGNVRVENLEGFNLIANADGDISSIETFYLKGDVDSEMIGLKKFTYDIKSKNGAAGRTGFDFKFTQDGKHLFSGTTDFTTKMDKGRTIIEGKSTIKLTDGKSDEVSFKIIRNLFETPRDGESGFGGIVTLIIGPRNFAGELKLTDKELHGKYTGCETKNRCTNLEARSVVEKSTLDGFKHNLILTVDLREVGFSHEFGLKADTSREGWKVNHAVDAYLQSKDKPEYQYSLFIKPTEAGALLSLPRRQVALDATYKYPEASPFGDYDGTISFYMDKKNNPRQKTQVGFNGKLTQDSRNLVTGKAELNFQHPRVKKLRVGGEFSANPDAMDVKSKIEFDVFTNPMDMIVIATNFGNSDNSGRGFNISSDVEVYSKGLGINMKYHEHAGLSFDQKLFTVGSELTLPIDDFRFGVNAFANDRGAEVVAVAFNQQVLKSVAAYDLGKYDINVETTVQYLGSEPVVQRAAINGLTQGSFTMSKGRLFKVDSGYGIGKDIHLIVAGSGKEVFNGKIALDQAHFLNSNYHVDEAQFKAFSQNLQDEIKKNIQSADNEVKQKFERVQSFWTQKLDKIQKASPDFSQFQNEYEQELNKLVEELKQDPAIKKIIDQVAGIVAELGKAFSQISAAIAEQLTLIHKLINENYEQAMKVFNDSILPEIKKLYQSVQQLLSEVYEQSVKLLTAAFERIAKALKTFEEDFNTISKAIKDATGDTYEAIGEFIKNISQELKEICETLRTQFQTLPGVDYIKQKYTEILGDINPVETIKNVFLELMSALAEVVPEQAKPLFNQVSDYLKKKIAGEQVDDITALKELYKAFLEAISGLKSQYVDGFSTASLTSSVNLDIFKRLPPFITNVRLSAFNQLRSEPIFNLRDLIYLYRPYAFNPAELLPPFTLHGEISDGSHIFTFDGRHMTFPGKCSYILARDFVGGNFSIVANMNNGKLRSISLTDKSGYLEVNSDGLLKAADKNTEYPYHIGTLHAWRNYYTVSVLSEYGAEVECSEDLKTCHVRVSGFYSGRTRGLLGNGNNEPYDDYFLPNGKITESTSELGNAYRTRQDCAAVSESGDKHPKSSSNEFCTQFFGRDSPLRLCYLFVNPANYREACEHATIGSSNAQNEACNIAATYASRCRQEHIPVSVPKACRSCSVGGKPVAVGDQVSVKVPQKQADIVVVFDTALGKDQTVVQEIMNEVKRELKTNGINDIQVAAIGYNEDDKYFYQYTSNGKLDFRGNFAQLKATGPKEDETLQTFNSDIDDALNNLANYNREARHDLGVSPDARAFYQAVRYPFRPTATKTVIAFRSNGVPYSSNPSKLLAGEVSARQSLENGIAVHAVMPVTITEPADRAKNIVGFNNNVALLLNEKKRPNMGSVEIASKLKYEPDMGVDITRKNGYIFNLKAYQTDKKKFVGIAGYVLADIIARTEVQSDCTCELASGLYPETRCKATEQKLLAPSTKKAAKGR